MPKLSEEERQRRALVRARKKALAAEADDMRLEQRRKQWERDGMYLSREELIAGEPCRGCGQSILDELGGWPAPLKMTPEEREDRDHAEARFRELHGQCRSHRWSMSGHRATHCGYCCPPPPMSEKRIEELSRILGIIH